MQLQIECNRFAGEKYICCMCEDGFESQEALVIACSDQGIGYGEVCPQCLANGFGWLSSRFERINKPKKAVTVLERKKLDRLASA
ncbi:MAG TPA: hypothetical protein V6C78_09235 [Crinalium sp.]|jgi:hypothetical protein